MLQTVKATVRKSKIEIEEPVKIPDGTKLLVVILKEYEQDEFWLNASSSSLSKIWDNTKDDIYARLLKK